MNTGSLFIRELRFRPGTVLLGLLAVAAVAACVAGSRSFLAAHDAETRQLVISLEQRAAERMEKLRDDARQFSKSLGFNILLLPDGQDPATFYAENRSTHFFTPEQARTLGQARLATLNHLLPTLRHRQRWDYFGGDVILIGIEGEIYIKGAFQQPIAERIEPGQLHLGDAIHKRLNLNIGDPVTLNGETFTVRRFLPPEGNEDDISVLMNLGDVQRLTGQPGKIGGILALSCDCQAGDLTPIRAELSRLLPNVRIVEFTVRAKARQQAREAVDKSTRAEMADIQTSRGSLRGQVAALAGILVTLVSTGTLIILLVLTITSARERRPEVAMLRALGFKSRSILALFLFKALLTGALGGILGCLAGLAAGHLLAGPHAELPLATGVLIVLAAVVISIVASLVPAIMAARTDPATILNQE